MRSRENNPPVFYAAFPIEFSRRLLNRIWNRRKAFTEQQMPKTREEIQAKLNQAEKDIIAGNVHTQEEAESYFKAKFGRRQLQNHL